MSLPALKPTRRASPLKLPGAARQVGAHVAAADGLVEVFTYQAYCGLLLLILTLLLPVLWHSHYFPPMSCQRPTMMRRLAPLHEMSERSSEAASACPSASVSDVMQTNL